MQNNQEVKDCPFCGEEIKAAAIKCKHCQSFINERFDLKESSIKTIKPKSKHNLKLLFIVGGMFFIIIAVILIVGQISDNRIEGTIPEEPIAGYYIEERRGNTSGNINNRGIAAQQGEWIYYSKVSGIYKMRIDGSENTMLTDDFAVYLNVVDDWIYYVLAGGDGIYKIRTEGNEPTKIAADTASRLNLVGDWLYYENVDGIYKVGLNGTGHTLIIEDSASMGLCIADGWIYYPVKPSLQSLDEFWTVYKVHTDGSGRTKLNDDKTTNLNVSDGWIYYSIFINDYGSSGIYRMETNGDNLTKVSDVKPSNLNVVGDWMYFNVPDDNGSLYKMRIDGSDYTKLNNDQSESINVLDDWIFYNNWSDNKNLYRIRTDGSERQIVK